MYTTLLAFGSKLETPRWEPYGARHDETGAVKPIAARSVWTCGIGVRAASSVPMQRRGQLNDVTYILNVICIHRVYLQGKNKCHPCP